MSNNKAKEKHPENENVTTENGFIEGEAYPNCDGEPCANVADDDDNSAPQAEDFKKQAEETGISYQKLVNFYLSDCAKKGKRLEWT